MLIQSISSIWFVIGEVPSGYFADVFGRKKALMMTGILASIGMLGFALGSNFYHFLFAHLVWSTAGIFISGADSALTYDTLKELGKEKQYKKVWGKAAFYYAIGVAVASIIGGFVGGFDYRYPFYLMIPCMLLLIPLALSIQEPKQERAIFVKNHLSNLFSMLYTIVIKNKPLRWMFIYSAILVSFITTAYFLYQPYFEFSGLNIVYFGLVFAAFNIVNALSCKYAYIVENYIGKRNSLIASFVVLGVSFIIMSQVIYVWSFIFALFIQIVAGFSGIVVSDYTNQLTDSKTRATALSVKNLIAKIFYAIVAPFVGWFADIYSLTQAIGLSGVVVLILGAVSLIGYWSTKS